MRVRPIAVAPVLLTVLAAPAARAQALLAAAPLPSPTVEQAGGRCTLRRSAEIGEVRGTGLGPFVVGAGREGAIVAWELGPRQIAVRALDAQGRPQGSVQRVEVPARLAVEAEPVALERGFVLVLSATEYPARGVVKRWWLVWVDPLRGRSGPPLELDTGGRGTLDGVGGGRSVALWLGADADIPTGRLVRVRVDESGAMRQQATDYPAPMPAMLRPRVPVAFAGEEPVAWLAWRKEAAMGGRLSAPGGEGARLLELPHVATVVEGRLRIIALEGSRGVSTTLDERGQLGPSSPAGPELVDAFVIDDSRTAVVRARVVPSESGDDDDPPEIGAPVEVPANDQLTRVAWSGRGWLVAHALDAGDRPPVLRVSLMRCAAARR